MKVYVHEKGVILVGKAWEIKQKLMDYQQHFVTIKDWVDDTNKKIKP